MTHAWFFFCFFFFRNTTIVSCISFLVSLFVGSVVFSTIGHMAYLRNSTVDRVTAQGMLSVLPCPVCLFIYPPADISIHPINRIHPPTYLIQTRLPTYTNLSTSLHAYGPVHPLTHIQTHPPIYPHTNPSTHLPTYKPIHPFTHIQTHP